MDCLPPGRGTSDSGAVHQRSTIILIPRLNPGYYGLRSKEQLPHLDYKGDIRGRHLENKFQPFMNREELV